MVLMKKSAKFSDHGAGKFLDTRMGLSYISPPFYF